MRRSHGAWRRLVGFAVPEVPLPGARHASSGRRDFIQRLNEQHLAHELANLSGPAHGTPDPGLFDPKVRFRRSRVVPANPDPEDDGWQRRSAEGGSREIPSRRRAKPWLHYESLRGTTYPSGDGAPGPKWQDLSHSEAQRMQEMYMHKRMLNRKLLWLKMQQLPNPQKEAKMQRRRQEQEEKAKADEGGENQMYPLPFRDALPTSKKLVKMEERARLDELESRFRMRIREEKLENARIQKAAVPSIGGVITDPIQRHVNRRLLRQRTKIHAGIEQVLTRNSAQILYEFLRGVAISIVKVNAKRPRQTQELHYSLTSDHDPAWVQKQLEILAPKLRSQFAVGVNMGQTPNIKFVPYMPARELRRRHLYKFALQLKEAIPVGGGVGENYGVG